MNLYEWCVTFFPFVVVALLWGATNPLLNKSSSGLESAAEQVQVAANNQPTNISVFFKITNGIKAFSHQVRWLLTNWKVSNTWNTQLIVGMHEMSQLICLTYASFLLFCYSLLSHML